MGEHEFGRYTGKLILEPLQGNRRMRTTQEFGFQDADGRHWRVPPGTSVDGTSIPPAMWSLVDGLWEGKYRAALVVHDYHCAIRSRDWQSVHRMLYEAIRVAGATERRAKLVYAGVYFAGPRWESRVGGPARSSRTVAPPQTASGNILYALCRDPVALAVSEAIECDGTSALNWITSAHRPTDRTRAKRHFHCPLLGPRPPHRTATGAAPPPARPQRPRRFIPQPGLPALVRVSRLGRGGLTVAPRPPHLGRGLGARAVAPALSRRPYPGRTHAATVVPAGGPDTGAQWTPLGTQLLLPRATAP